MAAFFDKTNGTLTKGCDRALFTDSIRIGRMSGRWPLQIPRAPGASSTRGVRFSGFDRDCECYVEWRKVHAQRIRRIAGD